MFHLTPQEKSALAGFLTVCLLGTVIHYALNWNARPVRWVNTAGQKPKHYPPDINKATAQEFDRVPGIGPKTAENIVAFRDKHGPFTALADLRKVKGITQKNFQKIQQYYREGQGHD